MIQDAKASQTSADIVRHAAEIHRLIRSGYRTITVAGAAGTGKSTLIREVVERTDGNVCVAAFTGQATRMLQNRGIEATTIHRLIYRMQAGDAFKIEELRDRIDRLGNDPSVQKERKSLEENLQKLMVPRYVLNRESRLAKASLCIIDEASMVPEKIGGDLREFGVPLVAVGDPHQLGPVDGTPTFSLEHPDIELTQVYRQNSESEILRLATRIRQGEIRHYKTYKNHRGNGLFVRHHASMNNDDVKKWMKRAQQIICATNQTRIAVNRRMLEYLGIEINEHPYPRGLCSEKIVCLSNNYSLDVTNGMPIQLKHARPGSDPMCFNAEVFVEEYVSGRKSLDWVSRGRAKIYKGHFNFAASHARKGDALGQAKRDLANKPNVLECDWGYCVTVHKAQGSEWDRVLFLSEPWPDSAREPDLWARLHYTAVTRAGKRLAIIDGWNRR